MAKAQANGWTAEVDADYSDKATYLGRAFKLTTAGIATVATAQGELAPLVLQNDPAAGEAGYFCYSGVSKIRAGAAFNAHVELTCQADGDFETALTGDRVLAYSLEAAGAAGDLVSAILVGAGGDTHA